jgi:hypothetical protein
MSKSNVKEPSTVIETFIKRFREQLPTSSEKRKSVLPPESFWWLDKSIDKSNDDNKTSSSSINEKINKFKKSHRYDDEDDYVDGDNNDNDNEDNYEDYEEDSYDEYIESKNNIISKPKIDVSFDQPSNYKKKVRSPNNNNNNDEIIINNNNKLINENKIFQKHVENDFVGYLPKNSMDLSVFADMTSSFSIDDNDITETKQLDDYASKLLNQCDNLLESYEGHKLSGYLNMNKTKEVINKDNTIINESIDEISNTIINESIDEISKKTDSIHISNYSNNDILSNKIESNIIEPSPHVLEINNKDNLNINDNIVDNINNEKSIEKIENKKDQNIITNNKKSFKYLDSVDNSGIFCFLSSSFERDSENEVEVTVASIKSTTQLNSNSNNIDNQLLNISSNSLISPINSVSSVPISNASVPSISSRREYLQYMENEVKLLLQSISNVPDKDTNKDTNRATDNSSNLNAAIESLKTGDEINKIVNGDINDKNLLGNFLISSTNANTNSDITNDNISNDNIAYDNISNNIITNDNYIITNDNISNDIITNDNITNANLIDNQNVSRSIDEINVSKDKDIKYLEAAAIDELVEPVHELINTDKLINYEDNKDMSEIKLNKNSHVDPLLLTDVEDYLYDNQIQVLWSRLLKVRKDLKSFS